MRMSLTKAVLFKAALLATAAFMPFTFSLAMASEDNSGIQSLGAFRVKFISGDNDELCFNVKYNNKDRSDLKLLVLDETGEALFEDSYSRKDIDKKLTIPRLTDSEHVVFILKSARINDEVSCKVKITTRVVDDAIAAK